MTDATVECPNCGNAMNARYDAGHTDKLHGFNCPECQVFTQPNGLQTTEYSDSDGEQLKQKTKTLEQSEDQSMTDLTETETVTDYETTEVEREMFNCPICPYLNQDPRHPLGGATCVPLALDPDTSQHFGSGPEREFDDAKAIAYVCETCADAVFDYDGLSHRGHGRRHDHLKAAVTGALADDNPTSFTDLNMDRYLALCAGACTLAGWFGWYIGAQHGISLMVATVYLMVLWFAIGLAALYKAV